MSVHELLEMASLDALGLLDADERKRFEDAFRAAPPSVQAMIRREQGRIARHDGILPDVDPPPGLRARVIAAVRRAMENVRAGKTTANGPTVLPSRGISPVWRIFAVANAAAAIVFAVVVLDLNRTVRDIELQLSYGSVNDVLRTDLGAQFRRALAVPGSELIHFIPENTDAIAPPPETLAVLIYNPDARSAYFHCDSFVSQPSEFRIVLLDEHDRVVESLLTFHMNLHTVTHQIDDLDLEGAASIAIVNANGDEMTIVMRAQLA